MADEEKLARLKASRRGYRSQMTKLMGKADNVITLGEDATFEQRDQLCSAVNNITAKLELLGSLNSEILALTVTEQLEACTMGS
jgi:hypothetical protein